MSSTNACFEALRLAGCQYPPPLPFERPVPPARSRLPNRLDPPRLQSQTLNARLGPWPWIRASHGVCLLSGFLYCLVVAAEIE